MFGVPPKQAQRSLVRDTPNASPRVHPKRNQFVDVILTEGDEAVLRTLAKLADPNPVVLVACAD